MNKTTWNDTLMKFPQTSILQTWEWGEHKEKHGWEKEFKLWRSSSGSIDAAAMILTRTRKMSSLGPTVRISYVPHGPIMDWKNEELRDKVLTELISDAEKKDTVFIKADPRVVTAEGIRGEENFYQLENAKLVVADFLEKGWIPSPQQIQYKNTFWIDLSRSEDDLLRDMKQKTRYNVRLAGRRGVSVRELKVGELEILYKMYAETAVRDDFIIRPKDYYLDLWELLTEGGKAVSLLASVDDEPVAGLILFYFAEKSYYFYGMSTEKHREKMPNYLLQWEAIKRSKALGCKTYDLWGAPDVFEETDSMWGVYRFKEGLGGKVIQTMGAYDYPVSRFRYKIFQGILPKILAFTRKIRRREIQADLD